jgi:hypothetical protein
MADKISDVAVPTQPAPALKYKIARAVSSRPGGIEITRDEYAAIKVAKQSVLLALDVEGKFELLLANYEEWEQTLHDVLYPFELRRNRTND